MHRIVTDLHLNKLLRPHLHGKANRTSFASRRNTWCILYAYSTITQDNVKTMRDCRRLGSSSSFRQICSFCCV